MQPPLGNPWTIVYDGRAVRSVVQPSGSRTTWIYGTTGPTSTRVALAEMTAEGRLTYVLDSAGTRANAIIDQTGARTSFVWNSIGQKVATINALGIRVTTVYNSNSDPSVQIDAMGTRTTTVYNAIRQPVAVINPLGKRTSFSYANGRRTTVQNPVGAVWTTLFDDNNRQIASVTV